MTIAQRIGQVAASAETTTRAGEFAALAKFVMANGGVSKAARAAETASRDGNLGPRLARILKSGLLNDISCGSLQKTAATAGTLEAFADHGEVGPTLPADGGTPAGRADRPRRGLRAGRPLPHGQRLRDRPGARHRRRPGGHGLSPNS